MNLTASCLSGDPTSPLRSSGFGFAACAAITAALVSASPARADFPIAASAVAEQRPAVAYGSVTGDFAVAYLRGVDPSNPDRRELRVRRISAAGTPTGPEVAPLAPHSAIGRPDIAYSPALNSYFVVVAERLDDRDRVVGRALKPDGSPASAQLHLFDEPGRRLYEGTHAGGVSPLRVLHNAALTEFVVTFQRRHPDPAESAAVDHEVVAQRISKTFATSGPAATLHGPGHIGFGSHALAYAPSARRYLFTVGPWGPSAWFRVLDDALTPVLDVPFDSGKPQGGSAQFDIAFGQVEGQDRFLVVWSDDDNCAPGKTSCPNIDDQWTGVWGSYIDPARTTYGSGSDNVAFPISRIWAHEANRQAYMPRVAYSPLLKGFFVVWREVPFDNPYNDQVLSHIRGMRVVALQHESKPDSNLVISQVTGNCPPGGGGCASIQDPAYPDVATGGVTAMVVWEQRAGAGSANRDVWADLMAVPELSASPIGVTGPPQMAKGPVTTRISVTNPNSKVPWYKARQYTITWKASDVSSPKVSVSLLRGGTEVESIAGQTDTTLAGKNYGIHPWVVPVSLSDGSALLDGEYRVRVQTTDKKYSGVSEPFLISTLYEVQSITDLMSEQCELEANVAVLAHNTNTGNACGLKGPVWHDDHQKHFDWCMQQAFLNHPLIQARRKQMWNQIDDCLGFHEVTVTLTTLDVHDDCDSVSEGDWYVSLGSSAASTAGPPGDSEVWPGTTDASNVGSGNSYALNIDNHLTIRGNSTLKLSVGVVDCDGSPGTWFWPLVGVPIPPIGALFAPYEQTGLAGVDCSGEEEVLEFSGGNDWLGYTSIEIPPSEWRAGKTVEIVAGKEAVQACESDKAPYTAHIQIKAKKKAPGQP